MTSLTKLIQAHTHVAWTTLGLPHIITEPGRYTTRAGEVVTIQRIEKRGARVTCFGKYANGIDERWDASGRCWHNQECQNDIVGRH